MNSGQRSWGRGIMFGLVLAIAALGAGTQASAQTVNCLALWPQRFAEWGDFVDADGNPVNDLPCEEYRPGYVAAKFERFGANIHIYVPKQPDQIYIGHPYDIPHYTGHPLATPQAPELVIQGMYDAMLKLQPVHPGVDMTAVLLPVVGLSQNGEGEWDWNSNLDADSARGLKPCPISIYLSALMNIPVDGGAQTPRSPSDVKAIVAHEVYHCYQQEYFLRQMAVGHEFNKWWVEGTAKHFENLVYGCTGSQWPADYDRTVSTYRQERGYPTLAFFDFLGRNYGFDVAEQSLFMGSMATADGWQGERLALAGYVGVGEKFHSFGRQFADKSTPCVGRLLRHNGYPETTIDGQGSIALSAGPFQVDMHSVQLAPNSEYRVHVNAYEGEFLTDANRLSFRRAHDAGNWTSVNAADFDLKTSCEGLPYLFLATNAHATDPHFAVDIDFEKIEPDTAPPAGAATVAPAPAATMADLCGDNADSGNKAACNLCQSLKQHHPSAADSCLVGEWELDTGAREIEASKNLMGKLSKKGVRFDVQTQSARRLSFGKDGALTYNGSDTKVLMSVGEAVMVTSQHVDPGAGYWDVQNGKLSICLVGKVGPENRSVEVDGHTVAAPPSKRNEREHVWGSGLQFQCSATELSVTKSFGGFSGEWRYHRVNPGTAVSSLSTSGCTPDQ